MLDSLQVFKFTREVSVYNNNTACVCVCVYLLLFLYFVCHLSPFPVFFYPLTVLLFITQA